MKKNILMTCAALASVCIITSFVLTVSDLSAPSTAVPEPVPGESASDSVSSPAAEAIEGIPVNAVQYYLREHNGKLAVFAPDSDVPELVFDVYLSTLPAYDRGQLQMGIPIYSYEELVQRIALDQKDREELELKIQRFLEKAESAGEDGREVTGTKKAGGEETDGR